MAEVGTTPVCPNCGFGAPAPAPSVPVLATGPVLPSAAPASSIRPTPDRPPGPDDEIVPTHLMITLLKVPVRTAPHAKATPIAELNNGQEVQFLAASFTTSGWWFKVRLADGHQGFVHRDHVYNPANCKVAGGPLEVRNAPFAQAPVDHVLKDDETFQIWSLSWEGGAPGDPKKVWANEAPWAKIVDREGRAGFISNLGKSPLVGVSAAFPDPESTAAEKFLAGLVALPVGFLIGFAVILFAFGVVYLIMGNVEGAGGAGILIPFFIIACIGGTYRSILGRLSRRRFARFFAKGT